MGFLLRNFALLFFLIISCAKPPDVPICTEINISRGFCVYMISGKEFFIDDKNLYNGKTWWDLRPLMIYMPTESWVELKAFIIKICRKTGKCSSKEDIQWEITIKKLDEHIFRE